MECIFCKILKEEIPARNIYEDDKFIVILDAFPANYGHCLVIPKKHFENIFEIDEEYIGEAYILSKKVASALKLEGMENINILQNNGEIAGQSVNHFHIHVIPRKENDKVVFKSEVIKFSDTELEDIKNRLKEHF